MRLHARGIPGQALRNLHHTALESGRLWLQKELPKTATISGTCENAEIPIAPGENKKNLQDIFSLVFNKNQDRAVHTKAVLH